MHAYVFIALLKTLLSRTVGNALERNVDVCPDSNENTVDATYEIHSHSKGDERLERKSDIEQSSGGGGCFGVWAATPPRPRIYIFNSERATTTSHAGGGGGGGKRRVRTRALLQKLAYWMYLAEKSDMFHTHSTRNEADNGGDHVTCDTVSLPRHCGDMHLVYQLLMNETASTSPDVSALSTVSAAQQHTMLNFLANKCFKVKSVCRLRCRRRATSSSAQQVAATTTTTTTNERFFCLNPTHLKVTVSSSMRRKLQMSAAATAANNIRGDHFGEDLYTNLMHRRRRRRRERRNDDLKHNKKIDEYGDEHYERYDMNSGDGECHRGECEDDDNDEKTAVSPYDVSSNWLGELQNAMQNSAMALYNAADELAYERRTQVCHDSYTARSTQMTFVEDPDNPDDPILEEVIVPLTQADHGLAHLQ